MKRFLLSLLLLASASSVYALGNCQSGSYYNPETVGTGIDVQVSEDTVVVYRYGYLNGRPNYWVGVAPNSDGDVWVFDTVSTYQGATGVKQLPVGTMVLTELEEGFLLDWHWDLDLSRMSADISIPWCLGSGCTGSEEIVPLFTPTDCE